MCSCFADIGSCCATTTMKVPYLGVVIVTLLYAIFTVAVALLSPVECLEEPCNSEGLDSSVLGWATDFYLAASLTVFGLNIWWKSSSSSSTCCSCCGSDDQHQQPNNNGSCAAVITLLCMSVAYVLGGIGHSVYTNSGFDDNAGQQEFYIVWAVAFTFQTVSVQQTYRFIQQQVSLSSSSLSIPTCLDRFLKVALGLVFISWIVTFTGYIWCVADDSLHVDGAIDTVPPLDENDIDGDVVNACLRMALASELSWYGTFSLFWIPAGLFLRRLVQYNQQPQQLCAATWVMIIPWTFGIMLIVYAGIASVLTGQEGTAVYEKIYGAVVYHYGMLLGYFLFHNIVLSLIENNKGGRKSSSKFDGDDNSESSGSGRRRSSSRKSREVDYAVPY
jgi:hypothetical protein